MIYEVNKPPKPISKAIEIVDPSEALPVEAFRETVPEKAETHL